MLFHWSMIPAAIAMLLVIPSEVGSHPFDVAEAETELCEGPLAEYSGLQLGLFKLTHNIKLYVMTALFVVLFLGNAGVENENLVINIIVNTWILIVLVVVITVLFLSVVRGLMGRYKSNQMFKFYWTVPTILALLSYVLVSFNL